MEKRNSCSRKLVRVSWLREFWSSARSSDKMQGWRSRETSVILLWAGGGGEASECRLVCWLLLSYCVKYLCSRTGISNIVVELNETQMCATINKDKRKYLGFLKILLPCSLFLYINVNFISNSSLLTKKFLLTFYLKCQPNLILRKQRNGVSQNRVFGKLLFLC